MEKKEIISQKSIEFNSFSWKRLIAALLLCILSAINIITFGITAGRHIPTGSIMTFEGPSYFFASGLIPTIVGFGLILYCIFSFFHGKIINDDLKIVFIEKRFGKEIKTEINKDDIARIDLKNNEIAIKYLWLFLFAPYLIINYYYMILNFNQPFIIGAVNIVGLIILISIILSLLALIILFHFPQWLLTIYDSKGKHELWFEPFPSGRNKIESIAKVLGILNKNDEKNHSIQINLKNKISIINLTISIFLFGYGIENVVLFQTEGALFQTIIVYPIIIIGLYLFSKELRSLPIFENQKSIFKDDIHLNLKSRYFQRFLYIKDCKNGEIKFTHNEFDLFWFACTGITFIALFFKIIQIWFVLNEFNFEVLASMALRLTIMGALIMLLISIYILVPIRTFTINYGNSANLHFLIKNIKKDREPLNLTEEFKSVIKDFKKNFSDPILKREFLKRMLFILITLVISVLIFIWQYFYYVNLFNIFNL
ncbi:MAG: hypothetical protein ACTSQP_10605 [Promethearchaeota archaeon]